MNEENGAEARLHIAVYNNRDAFEIPANSYARKNPSMARGQIRDEMNAVTGITVVLDNARYQRCSLVMDKARELGIELSFLPSYSPNLNLIERFWKYVKKTCLTNNAFTDFRQFRAAIDKCIEEAFKIHAEDLNTLLAPKFQIMEFSQSQAA